MLSREDNELLCKVGSGTPTGALLRQYWIPALMSSELPEKDGAPVGVPGPTLQSSSLSSLESIALPPAQ